MSRLFLRVGQRWFEANPQAVRSIEPWQTLIALPWPTRFLGLLVSRAEVVPVASETQLGCEAGERKRVALCEWKDAILGIPAAEVQLGEDTPAGEIMQLEAALEAGYCELAAD